MNMTYTAGSRMRSRVFFYAGTGILAVKVLLMYSAIFQIPETLDNILVILGVTCLLTKIIFQQYTWKAFLRCAVLGGFTCICTVRSRDYALLFTMLVICAFQDISIDAFVSMLYRIQIGYLWIHGLLYAIRLFLRPELLSFNWRDDFIRHAVGMSHANIFSMIVTWMILEWLYLNYEKIGFRALVGMQILGIAVYALAFSRTSLVVLTMTLVLAGLSKWKEKLGRLFLTVSRWIYPILTALSLFIMRFYFDIPGIAGQAVRVFNRASSGRLNMWGTAYQLYGASLWGQTIVGNGKVAWNEVYRVTQIIVDNTYVYFAIKCGGIFLIVFGIVYFQLRKGEKIKQALMVIAFSVFNSMESFGGSIFLCFPLCFIGYGLYENLGRKREDEKEGTKEGAGAPADYGSGDKLYG